MGLRAIVFDFDGVIANTEPLHYRAYRDVLAARAIALDEADYYARYLGYDDVGAFRAIGADRGQTFDGGMMAEMLREKAARMEALEHESDVLFHGASEAVRRLAQDFPLAIASGALGAEIDRVLAATGLAPFFVGIVAAEDTPRSKPAPDPYRLALDRLRTRVPDLAADECLAIEDSRWGLESARAAGLRTLAITHTYTLDILATASDHVIESLDRLDRAFLIQTFGPLTRRPAGNP